MSDIIDTAVQAGSFRTLCAAIQAAGLVDILKTQGPWTLFAPNDLAFSQLPTGAVFALMQDIPKLKNIMLYHVVSGEYLAEDVIENEQLMSVLGEELSVVTLGAVMINNAHVIEADIIADNGVIHIIDSVMMPRAAVRIQSR